jgi:hypothetical protein
MTPDDKSKSRGGEAPTIRTARTPAPSGADDTGEQPAAADAPKGFAAVGPKDLAWSVSLDVEDLGDEAKLRATAEQRIGASFTEAKSKAAPATALMLVRLERAIAHAAGLAAVHRLAGKPGRLTVAEGRRSGDVQVNLRGDDDGAEHGGLVPPMAPAPGASS